MQFDLLVRVPAGSLLIGGHNSVPVGLHGVHASDRDGVPIVPSTALRGALRETLEGLVRGAAERSDPACAAGTGLPPGADATQRPQPCRLGDDGGPCLPCRLFGGQRDGLGGDRHFSALVLGEARPTGEKPESMVRPGVAIRREARAAHEHRLFLRRVPMPAPDLEFRASGRLLDGQLRDALEAAVRATHHVGSGRSRGLARVELRLDWRPDDPVATPPLPVGDVRVRVTLRTPAALGAPIADDNLRDTRREVPGSALRGAIGFALAERRNGEDPTMERLLAETDGADFGFLYPVDVSGADGISAPLPITATTCKYEGRAHILQDTLLDALLVAHIDAPAAADRVHELTSVRCPHRDCGAPLRMCSGNRRRTQPLPTRTLTRVNIERTSGTARDGHLFTQVLLERGSTFEGTIRNVPEGTREHLAQALAAPLSLGRGRAHGWGLVDITTSAAPQIPTVSERGREFDAALKAALTRAQLSTERVGRLVPVTLLAPLIPETDDGGGALCAALAPARVFLRIRRFTRDGGWDQRGGKMQPAHAVTAGSVFVLELTDRAWQRDLARLADLERQGIGDRRCQGYGQVLCFDPFILQTAASRSIAR
ncbi:MAG TPA: RAMP superfamily CRISPR-associated protein [Nannocystis sp.]|jgi:CRISPR-associated protein Csx10